MTAIIATTIPMVSITSAMTVVTIIAAEIRDAYSTISIIGTIIIATI